MKLLGSSIPFRLLVFLSAFLLFDVELMVARVLLPSFGSAASVWTTCLVFYQGVLLLGYLYASRAAGWILAGRYRRLHLLLVALPLLSFPFRFPRSDLPPLAGLLVALAVSVGLAFFVLSTTSVLAQAFFARSPHPGRENPWFLYGLSNAGSMIGLLAYPFLVEPRLDLSTQLRLWYVGYLVFVLLSGLCLLAVGPFHGEASPAPPREAERPGLTQRLPWMLLSAGGSAALMAVSTVIGMDAPVPMLWVLPLAIYLGTLVLCFARKPPPRALLLGIEVASLLGALGLLSLLARRVHVQAAYIGLFSLVLLVVCLLCHDRLARARPRSPSGLGAYYLDISIGGFCGALLLAVVAPWAFRDVPSLAADLVLAGAVVGAAFLSGDLPRWRERLRRRPVLAVGFGLAALGVFLAIGAVFKGASEGYLHTRRTFYGLYRVCDVDGRRLLYHGNTLHGVQALDPALAGEALAYYHRESPIGELLSTQEGLRDIGIVGLGAGGLLAYARPEQSWDFYEIDPEVLSIARSHFTYLATSRAGSLDVILGDARLSLEETPEGSYDVLVMDVFSSDFIPTHLVTREAVVSQLARLRPDGILVFHISNRIFDLAPVLTRVARDLGVPARLSSAEDANDASGATQIKLPSLWLAMSRDPDRLRSLEARGWRSMEVSPEEAGRAPWTDQRVDLLSALRALRP